MNKVILLGRLTKDPELRYTATNNTAVCSFTLAVDRKFSKDKEADFINCQAWQKTAEFVNKYFTKGQQVAVEGRIQVRSWDSEDGKKKYATEVVVEQAYFAGAKQGQAESVTPNVDIEDDDLPF